MLTRATRARLWLIETARTTLGDARAGGSRIGVCVELFLEGRGDPSNYLDLWLSQHFFPASNRVRVYGAGGVSIAYSLSVDNL